MNNKENTNKMVKDECINHIHLIDVANVLYGYPLQAKNFCEDSSYLPVVRIRDIKAGFSTTYYRESVPMEYIVHLGDILVGMDGEFNLSKWRSREAILNQRVCKIESKDESIILNQYLFHLLGPIFKKIEKNIQGSTVKHLSAKIINSIKIPLPPLPIQQEIVRILDTFTNLTAELTAELTARRKQYEYYRDELLTFGEDVAWTTLKCIADIGTGSSNTNEGLKEGKYPFFVRSQEPLRKNEYEYDETAIITAGDGVGVGKVYHFYEGKYALHQRAYRIHVNTEAMYPKFVFHYMRAKFLPYIEKTMFHGSVSSIRRPMLNKFPIPVLKVCDQKQIADILDKFDKLCEDISEGIPAEISARQKQYEYYRNKLLQFSV